MAEISFLCRIVGLSLRDWVRSLDILRELEAGLLLPRVERSQLRWFGNLIRMHASGAHAFGGFPGMSKWKVTKG